MKNLLSCHLGLTCPYPKPWESSCEPPHAPQNVSLCYLERRVLITKTLQYLTHRQLCSSKCSSKLRSVQWSHMKTMTLNCLTKSWRLEKRSWGCSRYQSWELGTSHLLYITLMGIPQMKRGVQWRGHKHDSLYLRRKQMSVLSQTGKQRKLEDV